jgi:hypothetical protein
MEGGLIAVYAQRSTPVADAVFDDKRWFLKFKNREEMTAKEEQ